MFSASDEFSIREKRDAIDKEAKVKPSKTDKSKKSSTKDRKSKVPAVAEDNRIVFGKVKISELKPCISKAFCEVNSITEDPTYEANKEFYIILNRLKR
jgi:hypothetical protein